MHPAPNTRRMGLALAFVTAAISGTAIFVNAHVVGQVGDATVYTTAKNAVAALVLLVALGVARTRTGTVRRARPSRRQWVGLASLGVVGGSIPFVLFFEGLAQSSDPAQAGFIHKTLVVWVALLAVPLLRERFTLWHGAAIGLLLAGQVLLVGGFAELRFATGELLVLAATLLWAVEFVLAKRLLRTWGSLTVGTARLGLGIVVLVGWVVATGRGGLLADLTAQQWSWALLTGVILAGFVASWYAALARAPAIDVTAVLVFGQVVTAVLSSALVGADLGADLPGLVAVTLGVGAVATRTATTPEAART